MTDELDSLDLPEPGDAMPAIRTTAESLDAIVGATTYAIGNWHGIAPDRASPEDRSILVRVRGLLRDLEGIAHVRGEVIDLAFKIAARDSGSREFILAPDADRQSSVNPVVKIEPGRSGYTVRDAALYGDLRKLAASGLLTDAEVLEAVQPTTTYVVNHTTLNRLARNRGDAVREVIEAHRTKVEPNPLAGRVVYPRERST